MAFKFSTITFRDFVEAMKKNGYRQAIGAYYRYSDKGEVYSACAYGQAALNLGVAADVLNANVSEKFSTTGIPDILDLNDNRGWEVQAIANALETWANEHDNSEVIFNTVVYTTAVRIPEE